VSRARASLPSRLGPPKSGSTSTDTGSQPTCAHGRALLNQSSVISDADSGVFRVMPPKRSTGPDLPAASEAAGAAFALLGTPIVLPSSLADQTSCSMPTYLVVFCLDSLLPVVRM